MKKFVVALAVLLLSANVASAENRYMCGDVLAVDRIENTARIVTEDGNIWELIETDIYNLYDKVIVMFDDNNTAKVEDDSIIHVFRY